MVMTHKTKEKFNHIWERTICIRVSLLKQNLSSHKSKWRYAHDANQWKIPKEVLSLIMFNTTPLIKEVLPRIMLTLYLWSIDCSVLSWKLIPQTRLTLTLSYYLDGLGFEIQDVWESAKEKRRIISSNNYITDRWHRADRTSENNDAWCKHWRKDKGRNVSFSLVTFLMIKLTLHLWSRLHPNQSMN